MRIRSLGSMAALMVSAQLGCASGGAFQKFEYTRLCMGVEARIVLYASDQGHAGESARAAFDCLARLDSIMSDYRTDSELTQLTERAGGEPMAISAELIEVFELAGKISHESNGAFDVTVGPAVALWRQARRDGKLPAWDAIAESQSLIGWRELEIDADARTARLRKPGMKLDLGAIAKGYAAQRAVDLLRERGAPRCLVALAGDIVVGDPPPYAPGWSVKTRSGSISLSNEAVSTSGDASQFMEVEGVRYSHIIDPRTGQALTGLIEVTVIAPKGELADALASACTVLGPDAGESLVRLHPATRAIFHQRRATDAPSHELPGG